MVLDEMRLVVILYWSLIMAFVLYEEHCHAI